MGSRLTWNAEGTSVDFVSERFTPRVDSRPVDGAWPNAQWPPAAGVVLVGKTVELRPSQVADAAELFTALDSDSVWAHVAGRPAEVAGMQDLINWKLSEPTWFPWTVRLVETGEIVGTTSYLETSRADARTEIGSTLYRQDVWGTRVNPECKLLLLEHAFDVLQMGRVQLKTDIRNERSQQAIARLGAEFEGVLRRYQRRADQSVRDTVLFSIVAEQWSSVRKGLEERVSG